MFELWLTLRFMKSGREKFLNPVSWLALIGMGLGVAVLVVVMSVVSGFQSTLQSAVVDVTGNILILKRGEPIENLDKFVPRLKKIAPDIVAATPFVHVEGMVAHKGRVSGIVVQGLDLASSEQVLNLKSRIVRGVYSLGRGDEEKPPVLVGRGLSEKLGIEVGDVVSVVLPKNNPTTKISGFSAQLKKFAVVGVVDLGMYEYDSRFLITTARAAQKLAGIGPAFTGLRVKLENPNNAPQASLDIGSELGLGYLVRDWVEAHHNLFEAIKLEKIVIFLVLLFMTIAACFNISSTLFISVLKRTHDVATLKSFGTTDFSILRLFAYQGIILGFLGTMGGLMLGLFVCWLISKTNLIYVPAEIYHISRLPVDLRWSDLSLITLASLILCFVSTLGPALRGARMLPVEGLRYD